MRSARQIELFNGPFDGRIENLEGGLPPDEVGIPDDRDSRLYHYYQVRQGKGLFVRSERNKGRWSPYRGIN